MGETSEGGVVMGERDGTGESVASSDDLFVVVGEQTGGAPIVAGDLTEWMLSEESRAMEGRPLFNELCWRMVGQGIPLWRANLSIGTLHPQIMGIGFRWWRSPPRTQEFRVRHGMERRSDYLESPMRPVIEQRLTVRHRLDGSEPIERYPVLVEMRAAGATDYLAYPLSAFVGRHRVVTWATDRPGGFTAEHIAAIRALLPALGLVVESKALYRISSSLLDTYLGRTIGRHILNGEVQRGTGQRLRAALMSTDLRGFTALSDRLPSTELIMLLDDYFEAVTSAVHERGGEILKFVGDGVLAIFEPGHRTESEAAAAALAAAEEALRRIDVVNENREAVGQDLIRFGIGLHLGEVIYGNVGAADRLDFTAIGPAVNLVCRLEALTKRFDRPLLVSEAFAAAVERPLMSLGFQPVRGLSEPQEVFAPLLAA